jgi:5-methylcytosine-specific restriction endonuclease McrA
VTHGTTNGYRRGCRCDACRAAHGIAHTAYHAAHLDQERTRYSAYHANHPEQGAAYYASHADQERTRKSAYRLAHLERERVRQVARYVANGERARALGRAHSAAWRAAHPEQRRARDHRRRARVAGAPELEIFTLADVVRRDGWGCALCSLPVDPLARGRMGKSLDHVIALARGGSHTAANSQLAHVGCNARKGARDATPSQLRLTG